MKVFLPFKEFYLRLYIIFFVKNCEIRVSKNNSNYPRLPKGHFTFARKNFKTNLNKKPIYYEAKFT